MDIKTTTLSIAIIALSGCAATYEPPTTGPRSTVNYSNLASTNIIYFDFFENSKICGNRRPIEQIHEKQKFSTQVKTNEDVTFRIMYSSGFPTVTTCDMYHTFEAKEGYDYEITSDFDGSLCIVEVIETKDGLSQPAEQRSRQSTHNLAGDMAKSWCEPEV